MGSIPIEGEWSFVAQLVERQTVIDFCPFPASTDHQDSKTGLITRFGDGIGAVPHRKTSPPRRPSMGVRGRRCEQLEGGDRRLDGEDLHRRELYIERYAGPTLPAPVTAQQEEGPPRL